MDMTPSKPAAAETLAGALENDVLDLYYQPQVELSQRWPRIVGYEALARWQLPNGLFVPPDRFIPVAEECGLMTKLDIWVIEKVCRKLARMKQSGAPRCLTMSANVSAQQFGRPDFAQSVADILDRTGVDPACLTLEITERAVLDQTETTLRNLHALRELGVAISLDDFGTGYSSLFHLRTLPIQEVKLDKSFIAQLPQGRRETAIVSATINLATDLSLRVVAEGVETATQVEWLKKKGCHLVQGFLFGCPAKPFARPVTTP
jgi:EAL domain-containing protein (putative c-di-GMP-specific phosphodiesterase class I)